MVPVKWYELKRCCKLSGKMTGISWYNPGRGPESICLDKMDSKGEEILLGFLDTGKRSAVVTQPTKQNLNVQFD